MDRLPPIEPAPASTQPAHSRAAGRAVRSLIAGLAYALLTPAHAQLPVGATVVHGNAAIASTGNGMTVTNSPSTILNWQSFSIGAPNSVHFQQQNAASQILNRVTGRDPSQILGSLSSNGGVWLINSRGILFGANARIDVAGLVASTLDISNADFLANRFNFAASDTDPVEVLNQGEMRTSFGGRVWLLGEKVRNEGLIDTPGGHIVLAAGKSIELVDSGVPNVIVRVNAPENEAVNLGSLVANGGSIDLHGSIVNQDGIVRADSVGTDASGRLILRASDSVLLSEDSQTTAQGGKIEVAAGTVNNRGHIAGQEITVNAEQILQQGEIKAPGGRITLAAGSSFYLDGAVDVSDPLGTGGSLWLTTGKLEGMAGGSLRADGREGGSLHVEGRGMVAFSSTLSATGSERGGRVEVTGDRVYLLNADVDASGGTQGGTVHLGGGWQGQGDLPQAREVVVGVGSEVRANATPAGAGAAGRGGEVVVWSTESSEHHGSLHAKDGGRIELSSKGEIRQTGELQTGPGGSVLFDPKNLIITDSPPDSLTMARKVVAGSVISAQPTDVGAIGDAVALNGDRLAVGAPADSGSVFLFTGVGADFAGLTWRKRLASGTGAFGMPVLPSVNRFGSAVSLDGDLLAVGAMYEGSGQGAVHLFTGVGLDFSGLSWEKKLASESGAIGMPVLPDLTAPLFGRAVSLNGDRLVVGASNEDLFPCTNCGAVHLFTGVGVDFSGLTWRQRVSSGAGAIGMPALPAVSGFGSGVALDGDRLAVGAFGDDTGGIYRGAVHLFTGVGADFSGLVWQKKLASGTGAIDMPALVDFDYFGGAVALREDLLAVGALNDDTGGIDRGAVHLFASVGPDFSGLIWQKKLASGIGATGMPALANTDHFGSAVALDGDRMVGGASTDLSGPGVGAVHLFTGVGIDFTGLAWQQKLATGTGTTGMPALANNDNFGSAVALDGDRLAVGVPGDATGGPSRGAVHLFTGARTVFSGLTWQTKLASGTGAIGMPALDDLDHFGYAVALRGDLLAVGGPHDDAGGVDRGAVHLFSGVGTDFSGLTWQKKLASGIGASGMPALANTDDFGSAVALDSDRLAVGAPLDDTGGTDRGAVYLFTGVGTDFSGLVWQKKLASGSGAIGTPVFNDSDHFGNALALDGDRLVAGAPNDDTGGSERGAVHLFTGVGTDYSGLTWQKKLASSVGAIGMPALTNGDEFGWSVALSGDWLAVGAPLDSTLGATRGATHLFTGVGTDYSGLTWRNNKLASGNGAIGMPILADDDEFGWSVALDGNRLAVGARLDDTSGPGRGAVYLFTGLTPPGIAVGQATFATDPSGISYLTPLSIASLLVGGTSVTLQANNDISVLSAVNVGTVSTGNLTLQAGRNITFNAPVDIDSGDFTAVAGDIGAIAEFTDPGTPTLRIAGAVTLRAANATLVAVGGDFINDMGSTAVSTPGRWLVYAADPASSTEGLLAFSKHYDQTFTAGVTPAYAATGNWFLYGVLPTLAVTPGTQTITYGDTTPTVFSPTYTGFIDGDTAATAGLSGTAAWAVAGPVSSSGNLNAGAYDVSLTGGLASSLGYRFADEATSTNELTVNARALTPTYTASDKTYDGTTAAAVSGSSPDLIAGDLLSFSQSAAFRDKNIGLAKPVDITVIVLTGTDAFNYTLASTTAGTVADITARALTATYTASDKTYDGTTAATVSGSSSDLISGDLVSFSQSAAFRDKNVGVGKPVDVTGIALIGTDAPNYALQNSTAGTVADITARALTATYTASDKAYDGTTVAAVSGSSSDLIAGDLVSFSQSAAFRDRNVGVAKPIDITAIALSGTDAPNYTLTSTTAGTVADITARALTATYTASDKAYDGTTVAAVSGSSSDLIAGDLVSFSQSAAFRDRNVGVAKPVDITAIALAGTDAPNYTLASTTAGTVADITARALTATYTASDKTYDGTTAATVSGSSPDLVAGDVLSFSQSAAFRDRNVGVAKPVDVTGIALTGTDALNYMLASTTAGTVADITARALTPAFTASDKTYDGSTAATVSGSSSDVIAGDLVSFNQSAAFRDRNVGVAKPVDVTGIALTGTDALNYMLASTTAGTVANITARALTATYTASDKTYDGTTAATVSGRSSDLIAGDLVNFSQSAAFRDRNVGVAKPVDVTGIALTGTDALNYMLASTTAGTVANITARALTATYTASDKTYDGTTAATVSGSSSDLIAGDLVDFSQSAAFRDKHVGVAKPVDVTAIALRGTDAPNYTLASTTASTVADITARALTVTPTSVAVSDKTYDGTTAATISGSSSDLVAGDDVNLSLSAAFRDKHVGVDKPVDITVGPPTGADAANYTLTSPTFSTLADITARALTATYTASDKTYDGTTAATVSGSSSDLIAGDLVDFSQSAAVRDKHVGVAKPVDVTAIALRGTDAPNYTLASTTASTVADITARALTVTPTSVAVSDKTYDGTTAATISGSSSDLVAGDDVNLSLSAAFRDKHVGVDKPVDITVGTPTGADAANYTLTSPTFSTLADITARALTATYTASDKGYDGTTAATVSGSSTDLIPGDLVSFSQSAAFRDENVGLARLIDVTDIALSGTDAANYALQNTSAVAMADIKQSLRFAIAVSDTPLEEAEETFVESVYTALQLALPVLNRGTGSVTDTTTPAAGFSLNPSQMSRDQMQQVLDSRQEFKKKLFADAIYKLQEDPSLAEVRPCASLADVASGLCRMTDAQRSELLATTKEGSQTFRRARLAKLPQIERKIAVLFAINDYADPNIPPLDNPIPDAEMVGKLMAERLGYEVRVVKNSSKADIVRTLNQLSVEVSPKDSVVIYYAGHGYLIDKTGVGYWVPGDGSSRSPRRWLSNTDVSRMLADIRARQVVMISDSCYSGTFTKEREVGLIGQDIRSEDVLARRSVVVMSSGGDEPVPDGGKQGHSIFAWYLAQTLGQVNDWQPGTQVFAQVRRDVQKSFPQTPQYGASALAGHEPGGDYLFEFRQLEAAR
jgi:filamentous hemagglutinin family protein